jgi:hypothetical protein
MIALSPICWLQLSAKPPVILSHHHFQHSTFQMESSFANAQLGIRETFLFSPWCTVPRNMAHSLGAGVSPTVQQLSVFLTGLWAFRVLKLDVMFVVLCSPRSCKKERAQEEDNDSLWYGTVLEVPQCISERSKTFLSVFTYSVFSSSYWG